jgi:ABC-type branched-subunit amino acid transport system ATPase component
MTLRDETGVIQLISEDIESFKDITRESTMTVTGTVRHRAEGMTNPNMKTGEVEVLVSAFEVLGEALNVLPFEINRSTDAFEDTRLKYRYLDLRNPKVHDRILFRTEVLDYMRKIMKEMKFTEIQRVSIARCLVHNPKYYILDEPTSGLDIISSKVILDTIKEERNKGNCILYSTHYMEEADTICDQIIFINKGKIIATGTPSEIKKKTNTNNLRDAFFALAGDSDE